MATSGAQTFGDVEVANKLLPKLIKLGIFGGDLNLSLNGGKVNAGRINGVRVLLVRGVVKNVEFYLLNLLRVLSGSLQREFPYGSGSLE